MAILFDWQPKRALSLGLRYRYIALALSLNTLGNSTICGVGGIMMMTELSEKFSRLGRFLTVAVSVYPVPLVVMFLGLQL